MKISIVTLSFNQRAYLQQAIDSVLSQGCEDLEYIVVDPGSTDGSRELIESYGKRITHTLFEPDRGAADGLNKGFALATGDVFGFLNADDVFFPGALMRVSSFFDAHPNYDMAMGNGFVIDGDNRKTRHIIARDFSVRRYLYGGTRWMQQSTFFRREVFLRTAQFNLENRTCWDGELFVNIAKQGAKVGYIPADLAGFRVHAASISGSGRLNAQYKQDCLRIFRQVQGHDWGMADDVVRFFYRVEGVLKKVGGKLQSRSEMGSA